jgi:hypothetical protein
MRSDYDVIAIVRAEPRGFLWGILACNAWWVLLLVLQGCALWQLGTPPGKGTPLRPCVGEYVSPDSAGVCRPAKEKP